MSAFPQVMGILNLTADSFSDGGSWLEPQAAIQHGIKMHHTGAAIIDIGAESTRPGATEISLETEWERIRPVLEGLKRQIPACKISIDTQKTEIARRAIELGANMINDISAFSFQPDLAELIAKHPHVEVVLMHIQGRPQNMQIAPHYTDVLCEVRDYLAQRVEYAMQQGIAKDHIYIDPGIGFGKNLEHNLTLLANLDVFAGYQVLLGASRKSFIGAIDGSQADARLGGSFAAAAVANPAVKIIRVHDVHEHLQFFKVQAAIQKYRRS